MSKNLPRELFRRVRRVNPRQQNRGKIKQRGWVIKIIISIWRQFRCFSMAPGGVISNQNDIKTRLCMTSP